MGSSAEQDATSLPKHVVFKGKCSPETCGWKAMGMGGLLSTEVTSNGTHLCGLSSCPTVHLACLLRSALNKLPASKSWSQALLAGSINHVMEGRRCGFRRLPVGCRIKFNKDEGGGRGGKRERRGERREGEDAGVTQWWWKLFSVLPGKLFSVWIWDAPQRPMC